MASSARSGHGHAGGTAPFVPNREKILRQVAQPRLGLFQKAVGEYRSPVDSSAGGWAFEPSGRRPQKSLAGTSTARGSLRLTSQGQDSGRRWRRAPALAKPVTDPSELTFDTSAPPWGGDLGAFLRDRLTPGVKHVRVRVIGSGTTSIHAGATGARSLAGDSRRAVGRGRTPSWSPQPNATGPALIELHGGALVHLQSHLASRRKLASRAPDPCRGRAPCACLDVSSRLPGSSGRFAGDLIAFRSPSTQPYPDRRQQARILVSGRSPGLSASRVATDHGRNRARGRAGQGHGGSDRVCDRGRRHGHRAAAVQGFEATIRGGPGDGSLHDDLGAIDCPAGALAGLPPGPDRPWLITSRNCAFLAMYDRKTRETVLLRADADALARGGLVAGQRRRRRCRFLHGGRRGSALAEPATRRSASMGSFLGLPTT